jgi:hypothetical protein
MSSLQFLNKKSWHVNTRKNEEKVWLREQAAEKEAGRVAELQKQLTEERKLEEIRRLERESGNGSVSFPTPQVDWMYEGPGVADPSAAAAEQDALLLGQKEAILSTGQLEEVGLSTAVGLENSSKLASGVMGRSHVDDPDPLILRDAEAKLREDPLLSIRRQQLKATERFAVRHVSGGEIAVAVKPPTFPSVNADIDRAKLIHAEKTARKLERARIREERRVRRRTKTSRDERWNDGIRNDLRLVRRRTENEVRMTSQVHSASLGQTIICSLGEHATDRGFERDSYKSVDDIRTHRSESNVKCDGGLEVPFELSQVEANLAAEKPTALGERHEVELSKTPVRSFDSRRLDPSTHRYATSLSASRSNRMHRPPNCPRTPSLSADDRKRRLDDMQTAAEALDESRATRIRRVEEEEMRSREDGLHSAARRDVSLTPSFLHDFAREALNKAEASRFSSR